MALAETIVAAVAGLAGAGVGAWPSTRAVSFSARQAEVTAARAELAAVHELIWSGNMERQTRVASLRYRLVHLDVPPEDISALMSALADCETEIRQVRWAVEAGEILEEEAGIPSELVEQAIAAADKIALELKLR